MPISEKHPSAGKGRGRVRPVLFTILLYMAGFLPAIWLFRQGLAGQLGADPVNIFERSLGLWAFRFLLLCLAITPLYRKTGLNLFPFRRFAGLMAFFYACFHLLAYLGLDNGFHAVILWKDITRRPFIILGMSAFLLLLPLALTSSRFSMKRLGPAWKKLHRLIYLAACLAAIHFMLAFKTLNDLSLFYILLLACLLGVRVQAWSVSWIKKRARHLNP